MSTKSRGLTKAELVRVLSETLGREKADQVVTDCATYLELRGVYYEREHVLQILDMLANETGLVGVVARFAKARMILTMR